jgi:hypothetical protein
MLQRDVKSAIEQLNGERNGPWRRISHYNLSHKAVLHTAHKNPYPRETQELTSAGYEKESKITANKTHFVG